LRRRLGERELLGSFWGDIMPKIMTRKLLQSIAVLVMAVLVGAANAAPVIVGEHYEDYKNILNSDCFNTTTCGIVMTRVPEGKNLLVTDISCLVYYIGTPAVGPFHLGRVAHKPVEIDEGKPPYTFLIPVALPPGAGGTTKLYVANAQTNQIFKAHELPYIFHFVSGATLANFSCTILGTLIPQVS